MLEIQLIAWSHITPQNEGSDELEHVCLFTKGMSGESGIQIQIFYSQKVLNYPQYLSIFHRKYMAFIGTPVAIFLNNQSKIFAQIRSPI